MLTAPATEQVDEGVHLSFTVTATDQDGDPVALSANSLPAGATFSDLGNNSATFSWTPDTTQSGTYAVPFLGNDGHGGTGTASTIITVKDVSSGGGGGGGGGGVLAGRACSIRSIKAARDTACFRITAFKHSFDLKDVNLSSIRLQFHGQSIAALRARIELHCDHGDDDGAHQDAARVASQVAGQLHDGEGDDEGDDDGDNGCGGLVCGEHGDGDDHGDDHGDDDHAHHDNHGSACDTLGIRATFSADAVLGLFAGAKLPCALADARSRHAERRLGRGHVRR